jgi:hypothetical protein
LSVESGRDSAFDGFFEVPDQLGAEREGGWAKIDALNPLNYDAGCGGGNSL